MKLKALRDIFYKELDQLYPEEEINSFFYLLLEDLLGLERFILVLDPDHRLNKMEEGMLFEAMGKLQQEYPIQYVVGKTRFMDLTFEVNEEVLIPRPETEDLVRWILQDLSDCSSPVRILDVGTGSGCIAVSLAKNLPDASLTAVDVSSGALAVAERNARLHGVKVHNIQADIRIENSLDGEWDIIVSNPPYVRDSEKATMRKNVLAYEPASALFVPDSKPLLFYEHVIRMAKKNLSAHGALYLEINQYLGPDMIAILEANRFSEVELRKDLFGNNRMVKGVRDDMC